MCFCVSGDVTKIFGRLSYPFLLYKPLERRMSLTMALLSVPTPPPPFSSSSGGCTLPFGRTPCNIPCLASSSSSSSGTDEVTAQADSPVEERSFPPGSCEGCGKLEKERGCNGEGRIQGGIATVPGFGWWPIKAYRPCPGFVESGGRYKRFGQSMDDVVSGRGRRQQVPSENENSSSDKKSSPKKFTR